LILWVRRSSTTESPPPASRTGVVGELGVEGIFFAMNSFYRTQHHRIRIDLSG
jgi:hypothetical protein